LEGSGHSLIVMCLEGLRKIERKFSQVSRYPAEIQTEHLQNRNLELYVKVKKCKVVPLLN
jgi:hypothetical protein